MFHPKGGIIRTEIENYMREQLLKNGYELVNTPHITKGHLFETSQHLNWYKDGMFPAMHLDEEHDDEGNVTRQGQDYYLKPMNCPMHNLIFRARGRSYRELPLRLAEFGTVYRYEKSGTLSGLTRVRGLTQDDAHIYVTDDQVKDEVTSQLEFVFETLRGYGLDNFYLELSTRDPEKSVGTDEQWEEATETLRQVAVESGLELVADPGGAAFYGPKISVQARDAIGRTWQLSTVQLDFNQPELFELEYTASDGTRQQPVMIHRALLGSIERFFAILLEHYAGAFPVWLSPVQVVGIPVAEQYEEYLADVIGQLKATGRARRARPLERPHAQEDPQRDAAEDPVPAHRRRGGPREQRGELPLPRRNAGERHPGRRGDRANHRRDRDQGAGLMVADYDGTEYGDRRERGGLRRGARLVPATLDSASPRLHSGRPAAGKDDVPVLHRADPRRREGTHRRPGRRTPTCCSTCFRTTAATCWCARTAMLRPMTRPRPRRSPRSVASRRRRCACSPRSRTATASTSE